MRSVSLLVVLAGLLAAWAATGAGGVEAGDRVVSVADGDTLTLVGGRRVRLVQVDAPEQGECNHDASRRALLRLAPIGAQVTLVADPALDGEDRYGRLLRYVLRDGRNVNVELVRQGQAAPYFYRGERGRYASRLLAAATEARAARRGLWGACPRAVLSPEQALASGAAVAGAARPLVPAAGGSGRPVAGSGCDPGYAGGCVPAYPPDLDCADIRALGIAPVRVVGDDPHRLDGDGDGYGCE